MKIQSTFDTLRRLPLGFLCARSSRDIKPNIRLCSEHFYEEKALEFGSEWLVVNAQSVQLDDTARERTGLDLEQAEVKVAIPPPPADDGGLFWSCLPTELPAGFGTHIHGDFYLAESRTTVGFEVTSGTSPKEYNGRLLRSAADAIVDQLWREQRMLRRIDFWRMATPDACSCDQLKDLVAERLFSERRFEELVTRAFAFDPDQQDWTVRRYSDFFRAVDRWAYHAYKMGKGKYSDWRRRLLEQVQTSGASVLPIVERSGSDADQRVTIARPIPSSSRDADTIYLRKTEGFPLPHVVARRRTYVTVFRPSEFGETEIGMAEFSRPELLARLRPGDSEEDNKDLLRTALRIAAEQQERGGRGSVIDRCRTEYDGGGSGWRYRAPRNVDLRRAGDALAALFVPLKDGTWAPAETTTRLLPRTRTLIEEGAPWLWPILDEPRLTQFLPEGVELETACMALGISTGPPIVHNGTLIQLDRWDEMLGDSGLQTTVATALIEGWPLNVGCFLMTADGRIHEASGAIFEQLESTAWIPINVHRDLLGGDLILPRGLRGPVAPKNIWLLPDRGGFRRLALLPHLASPVHPTPRWLRDLGVGEINGDAAEHRVRDAVRGLAKIVPATSELRDLEELYAVLVRSLPSSTNVSNLPVLVRRQGAEGRLTDVGWSRHGELVWYDDGVHTHVLPKFRNVAIWAIRREKAEFAKQLRIEKFQPTSKPYYEGEPDKNLGPSLKVALTRALPEVFAACVATRSPSQFDTERALRNWISLDLRHYRRVSVHYMFKDQEVSIGDEGDVLFLPEQDDGPCLLFDGNRLPLADCARALAAALSDDRVFIPVFQRVLDAWERGFNETAEVPIPVRRMRRDLGVTDDEVANWANQIARATLSPDAELEFRRRVNRALCTFGDLAEDYVRLGVAVTPRTWTTVWNLEIDEVLVTAALKLAMTDADDALRRLTPSVDFETTHKADFERAQEERIHELVAEAALERDPQRWTELTRDELREIVQSPPTEVEQRAFRRIKCDTEQLLRIRLHIEKSKHGAARWKQALAFARGYIAFTSFPAEESTGKTVCWKSTPTLGDPMGVVSEEDWIRRSRRQASGGRRAEVAVLARAIEQFRLWRERDSEGLRKALSEAVSFEDRSEAQKHLAAAWSDPEKVRHFLHVSEWWGNAGFDILVPLYEGPDHVIKLVEVKRVSTVNAAEIFITENERIRAIQHRHAGRPWRLWIVASDGCSRDVTWVIDRLADADQHVQALLRAGARPGEWFVKLA